MYWQRNLWVLSLGVFISNISFTMYMPYFPNMLAQIGVKDNISMWTGILVSASFLTGGLMAPVWGSLADRYGKRIMLARSGYGLVATTVLMAFAANEWQLLAYRLLNGVLAGFIPASIMLTVSNTPQEKMGFALGTINSFIAIGSIMGPFVGGTLVEYIGIKNNMLAAAAILLFATTLSVMGTKEKVNRQTERTTILQDIRLVLKNRSLQVLFFSMVVLQMSTFMFTAILPIRVGELTAVKTEVTIGVMFSLTGLALAGGSLVIGKLQRINYPGVLQAGLILSGALCVFQGITTSLYILGLTRFLFGITNASISVAGNVLITRNSKEETRGRVFGVLNAFTAFGGALGPLFGGALAQNFGTVSSFFGSAVIFFLASGIIWYYLISRKKVVSEAEGI